MNWFRIILLVYVIEYWLWKVNGYFFCKIELINWLYMMVVLECCIIVKKEEIL